MQPLTRDDLYSLEQYAERRGEFRARVLEHKKNRRLDLGTNAALYFEDRLTMQYQVQEMLRIEKIFEADGILEELAAYNPLIPDGTNWKATFMIEVADEDERRLVLARLKGIENEIWIRVDGFEPVFAVADEDLDRENEEKTSSVHFLRFELTAEMCNAAKEGAKVSAGIDHPAYQYTVDPLPENFRDSLVADLD